ncbi:MAG: phenylacetate--CoA ligase family protein [Burkholderiaceae bacterium]
MDGTFFDTRETLPTAQREAAQLAALPGHIDHAIRNSPAMAQWLQGVNPSAITTRAELATLPVLRKSELLAQQTATRRERPFGGFATMRHGPRMPRVFASPGPIYEPEGNAPNYWRMARALFAAGFRDGDLIHNCFSYHLTPAGSMMETGAHHLGCSVFAGGTGQTEQQLRAMVDLQADGYCGTPSFLRILLEKADETGVALPFLRKALVSGEAFPPSLREWLAARGVQGMQCYATADVGLIAFETSAYEGLVVDEDVLLEIVRPGTNDPVAEGEVGEVVVTNFNPAYPLIRFGTGALSAVLPGPCPTGRTTLRLKGWMGRADQTTKVRGMFVHPGQVAQVLQRVPTCSKARLVVTGAMANDQLTLKVECATPSDELCETLAQAVRDITKLRATIEAVSVGSLPNDGKVIEDARQYD